MSHFLFKAAHNGDTGALRSLLAKGADIEWKHKGTGRTALIEATISGHREAVMLLLEHGAAIDHQCSALGYTSLAWASQGGAGDIVKDLIAHGAGLDIGSPRFKHTALMLAAKAGHADIVSRLIGASANPLLLDFEQKNACSMARGNGHEAIALLLEKAGGGEPPPVASPSMPPWPTAADRAVPTDDPARVVRAYIQAMAAWEQSGCDRRPEATTDPQFWADQQAIVDRYCTRKTRAHKHMSYGKPLHHAPEDQLLSVTMASASKADVIVLHDGGVKYEHCFAVHRKGDEWRIDSLKRRLLGLENWDRDIL